jgi:hypothetical protein
MSRAMSIEEFGKLVKHIQQEHPPYMSHRVKGEGGLKGKGVKYIDPCFDMRTSTVFSVAIRGFCGDKDFHTQNECRDLPESLFERIMTWLDEEI